MIAVAEGEKALARVSLRLPVLQRHFHRHFDGDGAGIGEEHAFEAFRGHRHQLAAQGDRGRVGNPTEHDVRHLVNLRFHRRVQARVIVAMNGRPPGRHAVNQLPAVGEGQLTAVGGHDRIDRQRRSH